MRCVCRKWRAVATEAVTELNERKRLDTRWALAYPMLSSLELKWVQRTEGSVCSDLSALSGLKSLTRLSLGSWNWCACSMCSRT